MEEGNKNVSYSQFKECVCKDLKMYFEDSELRKPNYEVKIRENRDDYDTTEELLYLFNLRDPEKKVPEYSLSVVYETYYFSGKLSETIKALAETIEKQYPKEMKKTEEIVEEISQSIVTKLEGYQEEDVGTVYLITDATGKRGVEGLLQEDDVLAEIAEKEQSNLQLITLNDTTLMALPVISEVEVTENRNVISELQYMVRRKLEEEYRLYDRGKNLILSDLEAIKEVLEKGKDRKKSIFSK